MLHEDASRQHSARASRYEHKGDEDALVVAQVAFDNVANAQLVGHVVAVAELEELLEPGVAALVDEVGARVLLGAVAHCCS